MNYHSQLEAHELLRCCVFKNLSSPSVSGNKLITTGIQMADQKGEQEWMTMWGAVSLVVLLLMLLVSYFFVFCASCRCQNLPPFAPFFYFYFTKRLSLSLSLTKSSSTPLFSIVTLHTSSCIV